VLVHTVQPAALQGRRVCGVAPRGQVHADHIPQVSQAGPLRVRGDGRRRRAGLGLHHRAHGAQAHGRGGLLAVGGGGHAVGGGGVHVGLRRGHHGAVLQARHVVAVHLLQLRAVHARVLPVTQLVLHQGVSPVGPTVHMGVSVNPLAHPDGAAHRVAPSGGQQVARQRVFVLLQQGLGLPPGPVFVIRVLLHVHGPQPLGLVDEGPLLGIAQQLPIGPEALADLRVVHLGILLGQLPPLAPGPHHEGVHGALHPVLVRPGTRSAAGPAAAFAVAARGRVPPGAARRGLRRLDLGLQHAVHGRGR